jgi:Fe-S-cluster containining protein
VSSDNPTDAARSKNALSRLVVVDGRINFVCLQEDCPDTCCGPFGGVQRGIDSVEGRQFHEIVLTPADAKRLLSSGCAYLMERTKDGTWRMITSADGSCTAFKDGFCSIHSVKPTLCKAFPFYIDMFVGLCGVTGCPGFGQGWTDLEDLRGEVQAAKEMYMFWLNSIDRDPTAE